MDFREFVEVIEMKVQNKIGKEEKIHQYKALKNNAVSRIGLVYRKPEGNISPTIYMEEFYEQYQDGASVDEIADAIYHLYQQVGDEAPVQIEELLEYHKIKDKIAYKLISRDLNKEAIREIPHDSFENLAVVPYVLYEKTELGVATLQIRMEHLERWGVDAETVLRQAVMNTHRILPVEVMRLTEFMYVMTNSIAYLGAATMLYPNALRCMYQNLGENMYVLPSSIHEVILVPESYGLEPEYLREIVREINLTEVVDEDVLTNSVYYYIGEQQRIVICG